MEQDDATTLAKSILELRRRRGAHLSSDLFGEHGWGILLVLFISDTSGTRLTAIDAFDRSGTPRPQGRRWMKVLMKMGLAVSEGPCDGHNVVSLTGKGISAIEAYMLDAVQLIGPALSWPPPR